MISRALLLLSLLFASVSLAQQGDGQFNGGMTRGNLLRNPDYRTPGTGAQSYFVNASTGSDSFDCRSSTTPCLTIQGAVNKLPRLLRDSTTVNIAAGNYAGFRVSGFTTDFGTAPNTAGLVIDGTLANSTPATGTATGTATGGSAGSTSTFGTLIDATQTWTANDLRGRFITITAGTGVGQIKAIASNTGTTITIAGTWTAPVAGSTYAVQDPSALITSCITSPPTGTGTVSTANLSMFVGSNNAGSTITLRNLGVSAACTFGLRAPDAATVIVNQVQWSSTSGTAQRMAFGGSFIVEAVTSTYSGTSGSHVVGSPSGAATNTSVTGVVATTVNGPAVGSAVIQNSVFVNGSNGLNLGTLVRSNIIGLEINSVQGTGVAFNGSTANFQGIHIDCTAAGTAIGMLVGGTTFGGSVSPDHVDLFDCATGVRVMSGGAIISAGSMTTSAVATGLDVRNGGLYTFAATGTLTGTSNDISLDNGAITAGFADIVGSGSCLNSTNYNSRVCRD